MNLKYLIGFVLLLTLFSTSAFASIDLKDGIVAYYTLDETSGTTADNSVSGSFTGTANNARVFTSEISGQINTGADFTQGNDYIDTNNKYSFIQNTGDFTVSLWFNSQDFSDTYGLIVGQPGTDQKGFQLDITSTQIRNFGTRGVAGQAPSWDLRVNHGSIINTDEWYHLVIVGDANTVTMYVNNDNVGSANIGTLSTGDSTTNLHIGSYANLDRFYTGFIDEVGIWDRALSNEEIEHLYNIQKDGFESGQYPFPQEDDTFTITAQDHYTSEPIEEFSVNGLNSVNGSIIIPLNQTNVTEIILERSRFGDLTNYTISPNCYNGNFLNLITVVNDFFQPIRIDCFDNINNQQISITPTESYTQYTGIYVDEIFVPLIFTFTNQVVPYTNISNLLNITISSDNYFPRTYLNYNITSNLQAQLLRNQYTNNDTGINISDFWTNQTINDSVLTITSTNYTHINGDVTASDYFDVSFTNRLLESTFNQSLYKIGDINFVIRDLDSNTILSQSANVRVENSETQQIYNITGQGLISGLQLGNNYQIRVDSEGFDTAFTTIQYDEFIEEKTIFLEADGSLVTVTAQDVSNNRLSNANVQIKTYVNGTLVEIQSKFTDVNGLASFVIDPDRTHLVSVAKDGFTPLQNLLIDFLDTNIVVILQSTAQQLTPSPYDGITFQIQPRNFALENDLFNFSYIISSQQENLVTYSLSLFNGSNLIDVVTETQSSGSTLTIPLNTTGFTTIKAVGCFVVENNPQQCNERTYRITDLQQFDGSLLELRERMQNELSQVQTFILFVIVFFVTMVVLSVFITGFTNVVLAVLMSLLFAWIIGMNLFLLSSLAFILLIILFSLTIER